MKRAWYSNTISEFTKEGFESIIGKICMENDFPLEIEQRNVWKYEIDLLQNVFRQNANTTGDIYFEFMIPRMGLRADVVLVIQGAIFIIEFKVGETAYKKAYYDQVYDYALDLNNFHESSHNKLIIPILVCTNASKSNLVIHDSNHNDQVIQPVLCNSQTLSKAINNGIIYSQARLAPAIDRRQWIDGRYSPTPTIIEAALALYHGHSVEEITRNDAGAYNLTLTGNAVDLIIKSSQQYGKKSICFITGVPGAGKTLAGLNIATKYAQDTNIQSVFLSGNGPLVKVLIEALVRDKLIRAKRNGEKCLKKTAHSEVKLFVQNVHHFRDECLVDKNRPPIEHVAVFDEAQRAWNIEQTSRFMREKKKQSDFNMSEADYLISCLNRHSDWATIVCLVGGGQEINTGEAGIKAWLDAINESYPDWQVYISDNFFEADEQSESVVHQLEKKNQIFHVPELHLATSVRSFRSENVSLFVKQLLDLDDKQARETYQNLNNYPIVLTRDLNNAKRWLIENARGSERYGIVVSSRAERLKPYAIDVKSPMDPVHWFLESKNDVRSSYYLEDVATEYKVQGLELDWVCVGWDADFRYKPDSWECKAFRSTKWINVHKKDRQQYIKNAYRVLLTRARQGMIIVVPYGDANDATRKPEYYKSTYNYLKRIGIKEI